MGSWRRQGVAFDVARDRGDAAGWWLSHAQAPTPLVLGPRRWRVFVGARDGRNRSHVAWVDLDPMDGMRLLGVSEAPVLPLGPPGAFDSAGQCASCALRHGDGVLLFYVGIHLRRDVPYGLAVGLATGDGTKFERAGPGPVMAAGPDDPWFASVPFVEAEGDGFRAWYMTGTGWVEAGEGPLDPVYGLATATSPDGVRWRRGPTGIAPTSSHGGLTRPWAVEFDGRRRLLFSRRGTSGFRAGGAGGYRLVETMLGPDGAPDALTGEEARPVSLAPPPAPGDWDGAMQAYASVVPFGDGAAMFYNGDDFGRGGFGWASWEP